MRGLARGSVAIVGAAESDLGLCSPGTSPIDLMAQATMRALEDCGLEVSDIDAIFSASTQTRYPTLALKEYLGIEPTYHDNSHIGGASFMSHVAHAMMALELGLCKVALVTYGSTQRSVSRALASPREHNPYETPYNPFLPSTAYAMAAARHMHEYGTKREHLAQVAVSAREWALKNPMAWEKTPLSIQEVLDAKMVSYPLSVRDCCLVTDGGGAIILTLSDRAQDLRKKPAYVLGVGEALSHLNISNMPDLTRTAAARSGPLAYEMARLSVNEVDLAMLYDAFSINTLLFLEDLGFCPKGEGGRFVEGGRISPGGSCPVNTNGGGLSYCHPGMYGLMLLIEATRQIRGECAERQISNCEIALAHGNGGVLSSQATVILGAHLSH